MCVQPCDLGQTYSGGSCSGTSTTYFWNSGSASTTITGVTNANMGKTNTASLVALTSNTDWPYKAAAACTNSTYGGYSNWYLPAQNELSAMALNYTAIGNFSPVAYYWSSTELTQTSASEYKVSPYNAGTGAKYQGDDVRCVRHN